MQQISVEKQGGWNHRHWSPRVLSLSTLLGVAALTPDGHVDDETHRKCMHVAQVVLWPHYNKHHVREDFNSMEAKLTLRVKGNAVKLGQRTVQRADGPQTVYSYTQRNASTLEETWMLRFATYADLEKAVRLFQAIRVRRPTAARRARATDSASAAESVQEDAAEKCGAADAAAAAVEEGADSDTVVAECRQRPQVDANALTDELEPAGVTPSTVVEGDVENDLQSIRSQWEQGHRAGVAAA